MDCLDTWISANPDAVVVTNDDGGCCDQGVDFTLPNSLTTMANLKKISFNFCSNLVGKLPDEGWENMVELTTL